MKRRKSILIVDNEEFFGTILKGILEQEGYVTSFCNNPSEAIHLSKKNKFDIIVTDYNMPEMNGADLARLMRYRFVNSFIIGLSCDTAESVFLEAGADAFFEKPLDYRELISTIRQCKYIPFDKEVRNVVPA